MSAIAYERTQRGRAVTSVFDPETEVAGRSQRPSGCAADLISCAARAILSLRYASGHIDVLHAQQLNQTIIVRFRGSDHE
jgi:hypothetical protein